VSGLDLKEKCDHGMSLFNPAGCPECDVEHSFPRDSGGESDYEPGDEVTVHLTLDAEDARKAIAAAAASLKPTNPKDALGIQKVPFTTISWPVLAELGVAMLEGALKYGRHNYRTIGVRASVYIDAANRHIASFWEGEDVDPDSGLSHVTKAIASLVVLRDAMISNNWTDDRPPRPPVGWLAKLNDKVAGLLKRYPNPVNPYTEMDNTWIEPPTTKQETAI
jgi:hypothetical protein